MNERIKELHDEAVIYTVGLCGQEHPDGPRSFQEVLDEKFAELIVRECADICKSRKLTPSAFTADELLEHFGVKE